VFSNLKKNPAFIQNIESISGLEEAFDCMIYKLENRSDYENQLVKEVCSLHPKKRYEWISQKEILSFYGEHVNDGAMSSLYFLLRSMSRDSSALLKILQSILKQLSTISNFYKPSEQEYDILLSATHIIRWYLTYV
jgi:hypothetical protein